MTVALDFVHHYLYGQQRIDISGHDIRTTLRMAESTEGWIGIPHGGIGMGILIDMAMEMNAVQEFFYPFSADFRLGGAAVKIGDTLSFSLSAADGGLEGEVFLEGNPFSYLSASIRCGDNGSILGEAAATNFPVRMDEALAETTPLPRYRHCFVCGMERNDPGLRRTFCIQEASRRDVFTTTGFEAADQDSFYRFQRHGLLHPLPLVALLDEILGWSGFFISGSGAVTVKLECFFHRPVSVGEKLFFWGHGDRSRGKLPGRLLFWASGGAAAVHDDGSLEWVVTARGQYFGLQNLTTQMRQSLIPEDLTRNIFSLLDGDGKHASP